MGKHVKGDPPPPPLQKTDLEFEERRRKRLRNRDAGGGTDPDALGHRVKSTLTFAEQQRRRRHHAGRGAKTDATAGALSMFRGHKMLETPFADRQRYRRLHAATEDHPFIFEDQPFGHGLWDYADSDNPTAAADAAPPPEPMLPESMPAVAAAAVVAGPVSLGDRISTAWMGAKKKMFGGRHGKAMKSIVAGAVAGGVSRTAVAPLETLKTHVMVQRGASQSMVQIFQKILAAEGVTGLFRGNGINVVRIAPSKAIELTTFDMAKKAYAGPCKALSDLGVPLPPVASLAGATAGVASTMITYPLDVLKTRLTVDAKKYAGLNIAGTVQKIARDEGLGAFYRGLFPSVVGVVPYAGVNYCAYDYFRAMYKKITGQKKIEAVPTLLIGSAAGVVSATATFPLEVIRRRMQAYVDPASAAPKITNMFQGFRVILVTEGPLAFYKGLGASCIKLVPAAGISFMAYEALRDVLSEDVPKPAVTTAEAPPKPAVEAAAPVPAVAALAAAAPKAVA